MPLPPLQLLSLIIAAILAAGGIALLGLQFLGHRNVKAIWRIWGSWMVLAPLMIGAFFLGAIAVIVFFTALVLIAIYEFARATALGRDGVMVGAVFAVVIVTAGVCAWPAVDGGKRGMCISLFNAMPVLAGVLIVAVPVLRNRASGQLQTVALAMLAAIYIGWGFEHLAQFTLSRDWQAPLLFLALAVEINDVAAYLFGKMLGRPPGHARHHPLRPGISPSKTWEGAIGALCVSMALPWALGFALPAGMGAWQKIAIGLIIGIGGQMGDLAISVFKRDLGLKDMGTALPGHGGVLDRIDSLLIAGPIFVRFLGID